MTEASRDAGWMRRVLQAAERVNPGASARAGAAVVKGELLIALAARERTDGPHAVMRALAKAGSSARGATVYSSAAPCRACRAALLAAGVRRLVIGSGKTELRGLKRVVRGVEGLRAERLVADYRKFRKQQLPYVTLKAAVTLDGRIAARSGSSQWITGRPARREAHRLRAQHDAVLVGVGTVLADDPELNVRLVRGPDPVRVVLDSELRTPLGCKLVRSAAETPTWVLCAPDAPRARAIRLRAKGVELLPVRRGRGRGLDLKAALRALAERGVVRLLVEGGAQVHGALLEAELADAAAIFVAPCLLGDVRALPLADRDRSVRLQDALRIAAPEIRRLGDDVLFRGPLARPKG